MDFPELLRHFHRDLLPEVGVPSLALDEGSLVVTLWHSNTAVVRMLSSRIMLDMGDPMFVISMLGPLIAEAAMYAPLLPGGVQAAFERHPDVHYLPDGTIVGLGIRDEGAYWCGRAGLICETIRGLSLLGGVTHSSKETAVVIDVSRVGRYAPIREEGPSRLSRLVMSRV